MLVYIWRDVWGPKNLRRILKLRDHVQPYASSLDELVGHLVAGG